MTTHVGESKREGGLIDEIEDSAFLLNGDSTTSDEIPTEQSSRDEAEEIRKQSAKETARVRNWRIAVTLALLATAVSVTATTYVLLVKQEDENFRNVYAQFARTVADAAIDQQKDLRSALRSLSDTISLSANLVTNGNPAWPFFWPPSFQTYAEDFMEISRAEFVGISNIIQPNQRVEYIDFANSIYQDAVMEAHLIRHGNLDKLDNDTSIYNPFVTQKKGDEFVEDEERDLYFVRSIQAPPPRKYGPQINWNMASDPTLRENFDSILALKNETTISKIRPFVGLPAEEHQGFHTNDNDENPHCFAVHPVYKYAGDSDSDIVAILSSAIAFDASMRNLLPDNVKGMMCVVKNTCNQTLSYRIDGVDAVFQGNEDRHEPKYDEFVVEVDLNLYSNADLPSAPGHCMYSMKIYPTQAFEDDYKTDTPVIFAAVVAGTFVLVAAVFVMYDFMVLKRNEMMIQNAAKSNAVVSSFLPDHLRERILNQQQPKQKKGSPLVNSKSCGNLKSFLNDGTDKFGEGKDSAPPLADLFLETTVMFGDISGFTAWSSVREPSQVFTLLETLYQSFDQIAKKRRVFKVETVGDCYVAVTGLPEPRRDHAVAMARFARDILQKMHILTKELEVTLGPDTGDLALRIGMHSGPVTGGVLRGERARFQLFGDTMNTCSRLEASSRPNQIQCSKETAEELIKLGKSSWVQKRAELVALKGKGNCEGYWVNVHGDRAGSVASGSRADSQAGVQNSGISCLFGASIVPGINERTMRLINWNVEMLTRILKEIGARHAVYKSRDVSTSRRYSTQPLEKASATTPLEEVQEIIILPEFDNKASKKQVRTDQVEIPREVLDQLHHLVTTIASMYRDNPFHNFDHASHVVMSVIKLMSRIVAPSQLDEELKGNDANAAATLHDHTYGITSDPLTQFACAFSALIHDVDHVGVSNAQLVKEGVTIAKKYGDRSVAEQNSLDLSWGLLMGPEYASLRGFLFPTEADLVRFRQLVVNSVMATDIVDKDLKALRNARWEKAFQTDGMDGSSRPTRNENKRDEVNRKATIVIEHIIQASDISHTMQHWHVYRKWNQNLFEELYVAYLNGRLEKDPAEFWAKGEIGFFDYYIIPLTQKLKECGVFGVSSDEYLNYALKNREEWETRGEEIVAHMFVEVRKKYGEKGQNGEIIQAKEPMEQALPSSVLGSLDAEC